MRCIQCAFCLRGVMTATADDSKYAQGIYCRVTGAVGASSRRSKRKGGTMQVRRTSAILRDSGGDAPACRLPQAPRLSRSAPAAAARTSMFLLGCSSASIAA